MCAKCLLLFPSICFSRSLYFIKSAVFYCLNTRAKLLSIRSHKQLFGSLLDYLAGVLHNVIMNSNRFDVIVLPLLWLATETWRTWRHLATAHAPQTLVFQIPEARSAVDDIAVLRVTVEVLFVQPCTANSTPANIDANKLKHGFNPAEGITQNQHCVQSIEHLIFFGEVVHTLNDWLVKCFAFFEKFVVKVSNTLSLSPWIETRGDHAA